MAGISRSATVVIAYIMKKEKMNYDQAYDWVKRRRPVIRPNPGKFCNNEIRIDFFRLQKSIRNVSPDELQFRWELTVSHSVPE